MHLWLLERNNNQRALVGNVGFFVWFHLRDIWSATSPPSSGKTRARVSYVTHGWKVYLGIERTLEGIPSILGYIQRRVSVPGAGTSCILQRVMRISRGCVDHDAGLSRKYTHEPQKLKHGS